MWRARYSVAIGILVTIAIWPVLNSAMALLGDPKDETRKAGPIYVGLQRGDMLRIGAFDAAGDFVPDYQQGPVLWSRRYGGGGSGLPSCWFVNTNASDHYYRSHEHRSGRVIKGLISPDGAFVPELGSEVIELKAYRRDPENPFDIYNLVDYALANAIAERNRKAIDAWKAGKGPPPQEKRVPQAPPPDPPKPGVPAGYEFFPYSQLHNVPRFQHTAWFAHVRGDTMELGNLDDAGDFIPDWGLPPFPFVRPKLTQRHWFSGEPQPNYYNLPREGHEEQVYEYRSGRLLKGVLLKSGTFVPELGSKVLDLKDYEPEWNARRIYNLPGHLRKKR
jgi:hypothetical protein